MRTLFPLFQLVNQSSWSVSVCSSRSSFLSASDLQVHSHSLNPKLNLLSSPSGAFFFLKKKEEKDQYFCTVYAVAGEFLNADWSKTLTSDFYSATDDLRQLFHPS